VRKRTKRGRKTGTGEKQLRRKKDVHPRKETSLHPNQKAGLKRSRSDARGKKLRVDHLDLFNETRKKKKRK